MSAVTNPDKVMFPSAGYTKADVVGYYQKVGLAMLPFVEGRPLTLERFPNGIGNKGFMQKNASSHFPDFIGRVEIPKRDGVTTHPMVSSEEGIVYLANQGTITFHAPTTRADGPPFPDRLVFDLDPPPGEIEAARHAARTVRDFLAELEIPSVLMASGSKGYHVVVALAPTLDISAVSETARGIAELISRLNSKSLTTEFKIAKRSGRVFVDWLRNMYTATTVAPWSLRPRKGAPAAVPLDWKELDQVRPDQFTLRSAPARLKEADPWAGSKEVNLEPIHVAVTELLEKEGILLQTFDRFRS